MFRRPTPLAVLALATLAACSSGSDAATAPTANPVRAFSEREVLAGYPGKLEAGMNVLLDLEPATATASPTTDTGTPGVDVFPVRVPKSTFFRVCFRSPRAHAVSLKDAGGATVTSVVAVSTASCQGSVGFLPAGDYRLEVRHAGTDAATHPLFLSLGEAHGASGVPSAGATADTFTVSLDTVATYDPTATYKAPPDTPAQGYAVWDGKIYQLNWWANPYDCPVAGPSPACKVNEGQWTVYDPNVHPENYYYQYDTLPGAYPDPPACTSADYGIPAMQSRVINSIAYGDMSYAAPSGGYSAADKEALYREYMLPCLPPDLSTLADAALPDNVKLVKSIMPLATWNQFASKVAWAELSVADGGLSTRTLPMAPGTADSTKAYWHFLAAVARYPYFCGEAGGRKVGARDGVGAFASIADACRRELAAFFAHAAQETGGGNPATSFEYLREGGAMGNKGYQPSNFGGVDGACLSPFDCSNAWSLYYGRGPNQLTHFYNYAGFSAARFATNDTYKSFNFLLTWPDLVAYDPELYFLSGIWFVMTNQPPKPSIHDVILRRYAPDASCTEATCGGLAYDATLGVTHPFLATVEIINGGVECRSGDDNVLPTHRTQAFTSALGTLGATLTAEESNMPAGCAPIIQYSSPAPAGLEGASIFAWQKLKAGLNTWIDLANPNCIAYAAGGTSPVSVTANGIVAACKGH